MTKSENIVWHDSKVVKEERQKQKGQKSAVVWFTGLSGAGKSTISVEVENELYRQGLHTFRLDGDNVRHGLNNNLGFSAEDRTENIRRVGEVAKLMADAGLLTLTAFISPYRRDRDKVRGIMDADEFIEVYVACDLEVCESRDPKGLYQKARAGEIKGFTGIDDPYEEPKNPELVVHSDQNSLEECVQQVVDYLKQNGHFEA
ncbi:adenylyl-sulfate kinase [Alkalibacillus almallahensis]|uniref:adenylyl-sulfate kinase n=1 Tax=Alkalibacillus almallahensis TaxID=1379154 RepID=UPI001422D826|nr:adenylyl-sulfate kinase [Alkalibacillus almallahensis]NIK11785.1 adenylylsulfate kinase [Alkalibacillus almallahensis]